MRKIFLLPFLFFIFVSTVSAHSGRTDAFGCHNCYTSECYGEYHCHNGGGYGGGYGGYVAPVVPKNPVGQMYADFIPHNNEALFDVKVDWADTTALSYSIAISKTPGGNPGPNPDTASSEFVFTNIPAGKWYVNIKSNVGGTWSEIVYWTIEVPKWVKPTPTPTVYISPTPKPESTSYDNSGDWLALALVGGGIAVVWALNRKG